MLVHYLQSATVNKEAKNCDTLQIMSASDSFAVKDIVYNFKFSVR